MRCLKGLTEVFEVFNHHAMVSEQQGVAGAARP